MAQTEVEHAPSVKPEPEPAESAKDETPKRLTKRQRTEKTEKTFDEYTFAELRQFHKQVTRELAEAKGQIARFEAEADEQLAKKEAALPEEAQRLKRAVELQLKAQMTLQKELSKGQIEKLKGEEGRDIQAVIPNVSIELLGFLGLDELDEDGYIKSKLASEFLSNPPTKNQTTPPSDVSLHLVPKLSFKYIKKACELKVFAAYKFGPKVSSKNAKKIDEPENEEDHVHDAPEKEEMHAQDEGGEATAATEVEPAAAGNAAPAADGNAAASLD